MFNYTGNLTSGFNPVVACPVRGSMTIDTNTPYQVNLVVSNTVGLLWRAYINSTWDTTSVN